MGSKNETSRNIITISILHPSPSRYLYLRGRVHQAENSYFQYENEKKVFVPHSQIGLDLKMKPELKKLDFEHLNS